MNGIIATAEGGATMSGAVSTVMELVPTVISAIMANEVLAVFFCAGVIGIVIGVVKRLK